MAIDRTASAQWNGDLKNGSGTVATQSGSYDGPYSFASRFESGTGTNPEELIAAAHASCFAMALSNGLASEGHTPDKVSAKATVTLDPKELRITTIHLECRGTVPGMDAETFATFAEDAKKNCPISKVLAGADEITLDAALEG